MEHQVIARMPRNQSAPRIRQHAEVRARRLATIGIGTLAVAAFGTPSSGRLGSSAAPSDTAASMYDVAGVKVIHRRSTASPTVACRVYLLGGARQVTAANAGVEAVMLMASEYGTASYPGAAVSAATSRTGSAIFSSSAADWSSVEFVGLAEDFDSTWAIVGDRLVHPTLDDASISTARRRALAAVSARTEGPDGTVLAMAESLAYAGHPYANPTRGTVSSLTALTPAMVREYQASQMVKSRMLVVIAGNVTRPQVEAAIQRTLGTLPAGSYTWSLPPRWEPKATAIALRQQQLPTNYILGIFSGPQASSNEMLALENTMGQIGGMMFGPMRDSGLTYAAGGSFLRQGASGGVIHVSTGSPDRAMKIIGKAIDAIAGSDLSGAFYSRPDDWGATYMSEMETTEAQVDILGTSYLFHGDFRYEENYDQVMRQTSPSAMGRAVRAYAKNIQWAFLGDTSQVPRSLMSKY